MRYGTQKMASRTLHLWRHGQYSFVHLKNHVLVTSFTITNKSTFVQRCLIGNLLSQFF